MLAAALTHVRDLLDAGLRAQRVSRGLDPAGTQVLVASLARGPGSRRAPEGLVLAVANVQPDVMRQHARPDPRAVEGLAWRVHVVVAARRTDPLEGLRELSAALGVLQRTPILDRSVVPALDSRLARVIVDIDHPSTSDVTALWTALGASYLPSVLCRLLIVPAGEERPDAPVVPYVTEP